MACTTILVGKDVSYDGSTIIARNEDSANGEFNPKRFIVVKPSEQPRHYRSVISHVELDLPDDPLQYSAVPNADAKEGIWGEAGVNEANVAMSATETLTTNERVLGADPMVELTAAKGAAGEPGYEPEVPGGIGEEDFLTIVLPYVTTAREGVARLGALLEQYGTYEMNGVAFSDASEIWWLETVGGHHWIAKRVPDEAYVTMPNQLGIDEFDLDDALGDQENHMCSADLAEFIEANHLDLSVESTTPFNPRDAFGSHSDSDHVYNTPRAWFMQRFLNPYDEVWDGPDADHSPQSDDIPWARQPDRKITIEDVKYVLSSHYQGTPYDPYGKLGDEHTRHMFRTIGINRQSQLAVIQIRPYQPQANRAIQWMAYGSNPFNALVPFYANVDTTPDYLADTTTRVTSENFYWENRIIAALCNSAFAETSNAIERYQEKIGGIGHRMVTAADEQVARLDGVAADSAADEAYETDADIDETDDIEVTDDIDNDIQPMEPGEIPAATRNGEAREILAAANQAMADQLKAQTDELLDAVLYITSMKMSNGFNRSDN
ncbi:C69 family dipeptidase [Bifidobacterium tibiigranuli]|jgi:dipeptidase|uniref:C69 family dipeptidase n=1 Tax=Bifidobacterium tibiigranuli TaxID=2172043 RepID=UPI0026E9BE6B|nr:C69 family dipeptidase [Bifidobacterium tibiigranuli]MCI1650082.1 C69 family dipeptidase [Bifidobacterium tibiigranuli]MCI2186119.1 C69 family dipeptidase [Bifidobacterium tibiigranuli]MCI2204164.1 C69 family dipeptidase [Bifidobacterium tibiigranuli]